MKYQTLIKQALARFIESEQKILWNTLVAEEIQKKNEEKSERRRRATN